MDWVQRPTRGWLAGSVQDAYGQAMDGIEVRVKRAGWSPFRRTLRTVTDGNGFFGFTNLRPGRYRIGLAAGPKQIRVTEVEVVAGRVTPIKLLKP